MPRYHRPWQEAEDSMICQHYGSDGAAGMVARLAKAGFVRTRGAVVQRAIRLKVTRQNQNAHPPTALLTAESVGHALRGCLVAIKICVDDARQALDQVTRELAQVEGERGTDGRL